MALTQFWPLNKVTDGDRWNAENLVGRVGIVAHAALLYTGFRPHGAPAPAKPWSLSCRYSLKQPVHRDGGDTIVMRLSGQVQHCVTLHTYVSHNNRRYRKRRMRFDSADLAKALSRDIDETARDLRTPGSAVCWLWQLLADELCQGLFLHVCRRDGVPEAGFASLPGDIKKVILCKLHSAKDLVRLECASKEMKELVAEHDADLWKPKYEGISRCCSLCRLSSDSKLDEQNLSWKQKYAEARGRTCQSVLYRQPFFDPQCILKHLDLLWREERFPLTDLMLFEREARALVASAIAERSLHDGNHYFATQCNGYKGKTISHRDLHLRPGPESCILYRRRRGAGAIYSPSSRYQWKHR